MKLTITIKELNQPSQSALKAFNQYLFDSVRQIYQNTQHNQEGEENYYGQKTG